MVATLRQRSAAFDRLGADLGLSSFLDISEVTS
jgi:hypothetical protein